MFYTVTKNADMKAIRKLLATLISSLIELKGKGVTWMEMIFTI